MIISDSIGSDMCDATLYLINMAQRQFGEVSLSVTTFDAGADYFQRTGQDIKPNGEESVEGCDAIFFCAISLPSIRHRDGDEISQHLRLRDRFQFYAAVQPM